jgi:long-chain acyl-CoA synthetase
MVGFHLGLKKINMNLRVFDYLFNQLENFPQERAFGGKRDGAWVYLSTATVVDLVNRTSVGLLRAGIRPGDRVATVVNKASAEWVILDFAMLQLGIISVPMYPTISPREYAYILGESGARVCVVGDGDLYDKVVQAGGSTPTLEAIYTFADTGKAARWESVFLAESGSDLSDVEAARVAVRPDDVMTYIYTSGTTGEPKGVMLTHRNIVFNVEAMRSNLPVLTGDRGLSFLPVSHIFERVVVYAYTAYGVNVVFTGTDNLGGDEGDLRVIQPHFFTTVPRLLEKVYDSIVSKGMKLSLIKRMLFFWALRLTEDYQLDKQYVGLGAVKRKLADRLIFSKWRTGLGGNIKGIITGANACPVRIMRVFNAAGIPVREGYGLTEAAPAISFNKFAVGGSMLGTVGPVLEGVDVRILESADYRQGEGEIWAKSDGVMVGYYNQPEKTAAMIREEGGVRWLATGDVGMLVKDKAGTQFLRITDRKKELLKTSGGKYVAPTPIESAYKEHLLVDQAMVVGEGLKYVSILLVPSEDALRAWCHRHEVPYTVLTEMVKHERVIERYQILVDRINPSFSQAEQVKKFTLLDKVWESVKSDGSESELTPTLKLKRRVIANRFKAEIERMYQ